MNDEGWRMKFWDWQLEMDLYIDVEKLWGGGWCTTLDCSISSCTLFWVMRLEMDQDPSLTMIVHSYSCRISIYAMIESGRVLGCTIFSKCSQIKPTFLHSMCIGEIRSHAKFQVSSFKDLAWPPLFVNQSWHWESHLKWPERGTFDLAPFIGIKNGLQSGITLGVLPFRKYVQRLDGNW